MEINHMESTYLKESLAKLATLKSRSEQIQSNENRDLIKDRIKGGLLADNPYPFMLGELSGTIIGAHWDVESAQRSGERLEAIERERDRFVSIFEALDIELDEQTLSTLELIGKRTWGEGSYRETSPYRDERRSISKAISKAVADVQESEREYEHEQAVEAIAATGFVRHEDDDFYGWVRDSDAITIEMSYRDHVTNYKWELCRNHGSPLCTVSESGASGDFHRLIALIQRVTVEARDARSVPPQAE